MARGLQRKSQVLKPPSGSLGPDELKNNVREGFSAMEIHERTAFIQELESEMKRIHLDLRSYLVPLGIPGRSPEDLTPTEVGHLIRFLKLNIPQAMSAVEKAMGRHAAFGDGARRSGDRLAA
jgi:hypothetical protein